MKTGTATIDINEYDRLMKVERDLDLTVNTIKEHLRDIELGITNAGYAWEYNSPHGQIRLGKGSKLIKLSE
jgi:hypothetical protein